MSVLEQVTQMKSEGMTEDQIISQLRSQNPRISPKEITDALSQARIKSAVSDASGESGQEGMQAPSPEGYSPDASPATQSQSYDQAYNPGSYGQDQNAYPAADYGQQQNYAQDQYSAQQPQQQDYYSGYQPGQEAASGYPAANSDSIVEISEQVFEEKIRDTAKKVDSMEEFKTLAQTKMDHMNDRIKRIESVIDKLQVAILEKVGSYGKDMEGIKKEMTMMQDSFSKTLNPLLDIAQKKSKSSKAKPEKKE